MEMRYNVTKGIHEVKVKIASGLLWQIILFVFYFQKWRGNNLDVAMIDPFKLEVLSIGDEWIPRKLYNHESRHIWQVKNEIEKVKITKNKTLKRWIGKMKFAAKYIYYNIKYSYENNLYEVDARKYEEINN